MKKYTNYKDSGVEWIGDIPEHWERTYLKYKLKIQSGKGITNESFVENGEYEIYGGNGILGYTNSFTHEGDDLIIGRVGALCGNVRLIKGKKWISDNALVANTNENERFIEYNLKVLDLNKLANKNAQPLITGTMVKEQVIALPSLPEQTHIANFLDRKTTELDTLIANKKSLIELLKEERTAIINHAITKGINPNVKFKDSGIEWIGEVPEHWEVKRLKYLVKTNLKYGANESAEFDNPNYPRYIRITDFGNDGKLKDNTFKSLPPEIAKNYLLENGDLLFARSGATVGKTFLFIDYHGEACFAGYLIKATFDQSKINSKYINYFTKSTFYDNWKESMFQQATIQNIGADKYNQLTIPISNTIEEQNIIVEFIETKTTEIDTIISQTEKEIDLLKEYKIALISEVVLGKVDVREVELI